MEGAWSPRLVALTGVLVALCGARAAAACDCIGPRPAFHELVEASQVFEAEVLAKPPTTMMGHYQAVPIKMLRAWKGTTTKNDEPVLNFRHCEKPLDVGKRYIFYTSNHHIWKRTVSMCSRVVPTERAQEDLELLGPPAEVRDPSQLEPEVAKEAQQPPLYPRRKRVPPLPRSASCSTVLARQEPTRPSWLVLVLALVTCLSARRSRCATD